MHSAFTSFLAGAMVVLGIVVTSISLLSNDNQMRLTSVEVWKHYCGWYSSNCL